MSKVQEAIERTNRTEDLSDADFDVLFEHFCNNGEMPYGTAKARDGDPYQWILDRVSESA